MSVSFHKFVQEKHEDTEEFLEVCRIGERLHEYLSKPDVYRKISEANSPGKSSSEVQATFLKYAKQIGFSSEKKGLFETHPTSRLRPDYFKKIGDSGILLEVERGKTIANNMDLLDFWKCHICPDANYLFLMVPKELAHNETTPPYNAFNKVVSRMAPFFEQGGYTNVIALFVFGY